jgi:hypothetical protein
MSSTDENWLDIGESPKIAAAVKLPGETQRGTNVAKRPGSRARAWVCDGEFVWFRRKRANPATLQRLTDQLARGELKHMTTSDDVEIYQVLKSSPFHRPARNFTTIDFPTLTRETVLAACKRDFATFLDGLEEIASRIKNAQYSDGRSAEPAFAKMLYQEKLEHIFNMIALRRGPSQGEIDRGIKDLREKRRDGGGRMILLPPGKA